MVRLLGWRCISMDRINDERSLGRDGMRITPEQWHETYSEMYRRVRGALLKGETVVLDAGIFLKEQRDELAGIAAECSVGSRVIYLDVPEDEARRRWQLNRLGGERHDVRHDDFELGVTLMESPEISENPLRFDRSLSPEEWIKRTFLEARV
jgi:predicted kinase